MKPGQKMPIIWRSLVHKGLHFGDKRFVKRHVSYPHKSTDSGFLVTGMIWYGLKFSIPGFFGVRKFGKYFLWFDLSGDLSRDFLGIQNNLKIRGSARVSRPRSSANKVQPNLFYGYII